MKQIALFKGVLVLVLLSSLAAGCTPRTQLVAEGPLRSAGAETLFMTRIPQDFQRNHGDCSREACLQITVSIEPPPATLNEAARQSVAATLAQESTPPLRDPIDGFHIRRSTSGTPAHYDNFSQFTERVASTLSAKRAIDPDTPSWQYTFRARLRSEDKDHFCFLVERVENFTPLETSSAHYVYFSSEDGSQLFLDDFFSSQDIDQLRRISESYFRAFWGLHPEDSYKEEGIEFPQDSFILSDNFFLDEEGISLVYNPHRYGNPDSTPLHIRIPRSELPPVPDRTSE